jgi:hypothetical protein
LDFPDEPISKARSHDIPSPIFAQYRNHGWLGEKDIYRRFLTNQTCERVNARHRAYFQTLEYTVDPDDSLTPHQANRDYKRSLPVMN